MIEKGRIIGLGAAYVDAKIRSSNLHLPSQRNQLPAFLDTHPEAELYPGGSISNILTAFVRLSGNPNVRLLSCVGNDTRGEFYTAHTDSQLGKPQVSIKNPTGVWVGIYDNNELVEELDFYGAAGDITVSNEELQTSKNEAFITDIDACRVPGALDCAKQILDKIEDNDLFILSLSGADSQTNIQRFLSFINRMPNVIFGTASELSFISHEGGIIEGIKTTFPTSRLVVITQGKEGAVIRFEEQVFSIPAKYISPEQLVDATGAGDSYMGTMLAVLSLNKYRNWNEYDVINAANVASYAATLVLQSMQSKLTLDMAQLVLDYARFSST